MGNVGVVGSGARSADRRSAHSRARKRRPSVRDALQQSTALVIRDGSGRNDLPTGPGGVHRRFPAASQLGQGLGFARHDISSSASPRPVAAHHGAARAREAAHRPGRTNEPSARCLGSRLPRAARGNAGASLGRPRRHACDRKPGDPRRRVARDLHRVEQGVHRTRRPRRRAHGEHLPRTLLVRPGDQHARDLRDCARAAPSRLDPDAARGIQPRGLAQDIRPPRTAREAMGDRR